MVVANNKINDDKTCRQIAGNFDCDVNVAVQCRAHRPMEHIQGALPPRAVAVGTKTPVTTVMAGARTTINNQLTRRGQR
jgi:hypothetical protein